MSTPAIIKLDIATGIPADCLICREHFPSKGRLSRHKHDKHHYSPEEIINTAKALDLVATAKASAEKEIAAAYNAYRETEKHGLEFGRVCCEWRDKFKVRGFRGNAKGQGITAILQQCNIPERTAYHWMLEYEYSTGAKTVPIPGSEREKKGWHKRNDPSPLGCLTVKLNSLMALDAPASSVDCLDNIPERALIVALNNAVQRSNNPGDDKKKLEFICQQLDYIAKNFEDYAKEIRVGLAISTAEVPAS